MVVNSKGIYRRKYLPGDLAGNIIVFLCLLKETLREIGRPEGAQWQLPLTGPPAALKDICGQHTKTTGFHPG